MSDNVIEFESSLLYKASEIVCLKCLHRWIAVRPEGVLLKKLECPNCGERGFAIETGEEMPEELQDG